MRQTVAVHAATAQVSPPPHAPASSVQTTTKPYSGNLPKCNKCNYHHHGECKDMQCANCNCKGHTARYCRSPPQPNQCHNNNNNNNNKNNSNAEESHTCYGCGGTDPYRRNCPKANAQGAGGSGRVLAIGQGEAV
ncbi:uncharacterized protein LOC111879909 [Lactuca sativa]|uniref:uncharacterized protein LOC111879909 n=1 Tax=Lactuca sativa TaxID=4236 RepID=UPI000CD9856D|nr:uncharacterized protein LOC111879909 [Lactuca sativa]